MKEDSGEYLRFRLERHATGRLIDPATAQMTSHKGSVLDPYGVLADDPMEEDLIGLVHFVCAPNSDHWVHISDLPDETVEEVFERLDAGYYKDRFKIR